MRQLILISLISILGIGFSGCGKKEKEKLAAMEKEQQMQDSIAKVNQEKLFQANLPWSYSSSLEEKFYSEFFIEGRNHLPGNYSVVTLPKGSFISFKGRKGNLPKDFIGYLFEGKIQDRRGSVVIEAEAKPKAKTNFSFEIILLDPKISYSDLDELVSNYQMAIAFRFPSGTQSWAMSDYDDFQRCSEFEDWRLLNVNKCLLTLKNKKWPIRDNGLLCAPRY